MNKTINCKGKLVSLDEPKVMGILNLTPDSFYDGNQYKDLDKALKQTETMLNDGAWFVDIGAMSSRPGAAMISVSEEKNRLLPVLEQLVKTFPDALFSIDTFRSEIAKEAIETGAAIINDISSGNLDEKMFETIAKLKCPYILMHMRGTPETMNSLCSYENLTQDIVKELAEKVEKLVRLNVSDIIIDPGFGFSKTVAQNFQLLKELDILNQILELPILAGLSRKSMIWKSLNISAKEALNGTTALNMVALEKGAKILRVHDVKQAVETVELYQLLHR